MAFFAPFAYREQRIEEVVPIVYDQDAQNFFTATGITDVGLKGAVDTFVVALKNTGSLWDDMVQICPLVGDDTSSLATQLAVNLRNTGSYNLTFPNGIGSSDLNGFYANSTSTVYAQTGLSPRGVFGSVGDFAVGVYTTSTGETGDRYDWGGFNSNSEYSYFITGRSLSGGNTQKLMAFRPNAFASITNAAEAGFYQGRFNTGLSPVSRLVLNGTQIATGGGGNNDLLNNQAFFGCNNAFNGTPAQVSNKQYQMLTVGNGLTDAQMTSLNTIVQNFQADVDAALGTSREV
jgi:hypothetical protein